MKAMIRAARWLLLALVLAGCADMSRLNAVPADAKEDAAVLGMTDIRFWGDEASTKLVDTAIDAYRREMNLHKASGGTGPLPTADYLAISGGGENGAYGAGLLCGWTVTGNRPNFKLVTGISTGALTAPFAFLGPAYDARLKEVYTTLSARDVLQPRGYLAVVLQDAIADNSPLRQTIKRYFDQAMMEAIAAEYAKGRILLVATTNLDARRPVIWDITKIAASGNPRALELIHDVLVASAAIPGAFPPVMIDAELNGKKYQEMHVDGGASAQVFVYPPSLNFNTAQFDGRPIERERRVYVIRNARLDPDWAEVERATFSILQRAVTSLIQTQGVGDLYRIYASTQRDEIDFNLAYIPPTFKRQLNEPFETAYMKELFEVGYERAVHGYDWAKTPPGYAAPQIEPPVQTQPVEAPKKTSETTPGRSARTIASATG
jgi:predicted acylesterase/phospholipase RssA